MTLGPQILGWWSHEKTFVFGSPIFESSLSPTGVIEATFGASSSFHILKM